jgi:hypoxanthine-guanine phosphoribosyltransferase
VNEQTTDDVPDDDRHGGDMTNEERAALVAERIMETGGTVRCIREALDEAEARGREAERKDVVVFLRSTDDRHEDALRDVHDAAFAIERAAHLEKTE